ncbi:MAG TPA: hypothetical protein DCR90_05740 [Fusobacteriaceae bacterium]|mgnify:CR=1 FL=1|nr:hypothetical protein [Fusobacteriaceae bacterium]
MKQILDFFSQYGGLIAPLIVFLVGWVLPTPKFFKLGEKVAETIPPTLAKLIAERLKAFERGLLEQDFNGDKTIVSNSQVEEKVKNLKIDLGLEELVSKAKD